MSNPKKKCFVIMPISMPDTLLEGYGNDGEHFNHIYEHLLSPALSASGYDAISPITKGSEIIHSEIIKNLEESDLVLCDISILNPNVFFELGIRTALNKPVCLIKDNKTSSIPFDTHLINCHTYNSAMNIWETDKEIEDISKHIGNTSTDANALWKVFGFSDIGAMNEIEDISDQIKYKDTLIENLEMKINNLERERSNVVKAEKYTLHTCSKCSHNFQISDKHSNMLYTSIGIPSITGLSDIYGQHGSSLGFKCPNCGHIDKA